MSNPPSAPPPGWQLNCLLLKHTLSHPHVWKLLTFTIVFVVFVTMTFAHVEDVARAPLAALVAAASICVSLIPVAKPSPPSILKRHRAGWLGGPVYWTVTFGELAHVAAGTLAGGASAVAAVAWLDTSEATQSYAGYTAPLVVIVLLCVSLIPLLYVLGTRHNEMDRNRDRDRANKQDGDPEP